MKLREAVRSLLIQELGDSTKGYRYKLESSELGSGWRNKAKRKYTFETDNKEYVVKLGVEMKYDRHNGSPVMEVDFTSIDKQGKEDITYSITNDDMFGVIATVANIIEECVKEWLPEVEDHHGEEIKYLSFTPAGFTNSPKYQQRIDLYAQFVKSRLPGSKIEKGRGHSYYIEIG